MENIIQIEDVKSKIIKIDGRKIQIKPYLSTSDIIQITEVCVQQFDKMPDISSIGLIRCIYDMLVIKQCTDIKLKGIDYIKTNKKTTLSININSLIIENFDRTRIIEKIAPFVYNYDTTFKLIVKALEMKNVSNLLSTAVATIPSSELLIDKLKNIVFELNVEKQKNPKDFEHIARIQEKNVAKELVGKKKKEK